MFTMPQWLLDGLRGAYQRRDVAVIVYYNKLWNDCLKGRGAV